MKTKDFNKKLNLNKSTIVDLSNDEMGALYGGSEYTYEFTICRTKCVSDCVSCETVMHRTCDC